MSERELNRKWLKEQLKDFVYPDEEELENKILDLLSEEYKNGLHQGWFDKYMDIHQKNVEINFLRERENKLQMIEQMFKNEPVDLTKLAKLVKGGE